MISDIRHPISDKAQPFNLRDDCACCAQSDSRQAAGDDLLQHDGLQTQRFARHHHCHHLDHLQHLDHPHIAHHQDISFNTRYSNHHQKKHNNHYFRNKSHPCLAIHQHYHPSTFSSLILISKMCCFFAIPIHSYTPPNWYGQKSYFKRITFCKELRPNLLLLKANAVKMGGC